MFLLFVFLLLPLTSQGLSSAIDPVVRIYYDSTNHWHRDIKYHSEQPERITACVQALQQRQFFQTDDVLELVDVAPADPDESAASVSVIRQPFTANELDYARKMLLQVHEPELVQNLEERCNKAKQMRLEQGKKSALGHMGYLDYGDTYVTTETFNLCLRATASWIRAVNDVLMSGSCYAFALTRPPGHHATYNLQNGFCLYNFAAAAALHAIQHGGCHKVSILDWDVHYGQGVADIVQHYPQQIRYVSIHQVPAFPYQGEKRSTNDNIRTIPMPPDTTWTCGYEQLLEEYALPFVTEKSVWEPDLVIVCAGYDGLSSDPLASTSLTSTDFGRITRKLQQHIQSQQSSSSSQQQRPQQPKIMLGLEGGYELGNAGPAGNFPDAVVETVRALIESY